MTDSVVTSPSGSDGTCVNSFFYLSGMRSLISGEKKTLFEYPPFEFTWRRTCNWNRFWRSVLREREVTCWGFAKMLPPFPPSPVVHPPSDSQGASVWVPPLPSLTGRPARWLCCPSPGASWRRGAQGGWRKTRSSAARTCHLRGQETVKRRTATSANRSRWRSKRLRNTHRSDGRPSPPWPGPEVGPFGSWSRSFLKSVRRWATGHPGERGF